MKCFYHPEVDAIGSCKNCGKGLCFQSCAEIEGGLACKYKCEEEVAGLMKMLTQSQKHASRYQPMHDTRVGAILVAALGLASLTTYFESGLQSYLVIALVLLGLVAYILSASRRVKK
jgi:hypothetical protein